MIEHLMLKVELPDKFPLSKDKQYDWFYLHKQVDRKKTEDAVNVPLKEMEFKENVMIYSNYKKSTQMK